MKLNIGNPELQPETVAWLTAIVNARGIQENRTVGGAAMRSQIAHILDGYVTNHKLVYAKRIAYWAQTWDIPFDEAFEILSRSDLKASDIPPTVHPRLHSVDVSLIPEERLKPRAKDRVIEPDIKENFE